MASERQTMRLCGAPHQPSNPDSPRCMLAIDHPPKPHEAIGLNGKRVMWPVAAPK